MKVGDKRRHHLRALARTRFSTSPFSLVVVIACVLSVQQPAQLKEQRRGPDFVVLEILRARLRAAISASAAASS